MEISFEYEQYSVDIKVSATELDGSDYEWEIASIYDNDCGQTKELQQLSTVDRTEIEKLAESKAAFKACDAAQDYFDSLADAYYDSRND